MSYKAHILKNSDLQQLFNRYLFGEASPEELESLFRLFGEAKNEDTLKLLIRRQLNQEEESGVGENHQQVLEETYHAIKEQIETAREEGIKEKSGYLFRGQFQWGKYAAVAAVALLIISAAFFFRHRQETLSLQEETAQHQDIAPGGNKAVLTLANGEKIVLDSAKLGLLSLQGNTKVVKMNNGQLSYNQQSASVEKSGKILYNTISTPRGGKYKVVLSDGTKVWLNAASSIYFPSQFDKETRAVSITGEAYFEVAEDADRPFIVKSGTLKVQVLGTHFDVMAYENEPDARVTLLEGSVRVAEKNKNILLKPGEQARISGNGKMSRIKGIDLQGAIAWKNNYFYFEDDDIQAVMRQLSRWYNVDVVIQGNIPQHFGGYISKDIYISKVFEALQATGHLNYEIRNNTIVVSP